MKTIILTFAVCLLSACGGGSGNQTDSQSNITLGKVSAGAFQRYSSTYIITSDNIYSTSPIQPPAPFKIGEPLYLGWREPSTIPQWVQNEDGSIVVTLAD